MNRHDIINADCLDAMADMEAASVDSIVTDPPYGLKFMGKDWDHGVPGEAFWREALRVAKPGAHLLAFGGTRMVHRLAVSIEDAGWEIRDRIHWVYGSGFPKSHNISKAIDKAAGAEREVVGSRTLKGNAAVSCKEKGGTFVAGASLTAVKDIDITAPATPAAQQWDGWGTALKPAVEPIILARKPFKGTVAANVMEHGTGGLNVDGCRVGTDGGTLKTHTDERNIPSNSLRGGANGSLNGGRVAKLDAGRFPANLIHDGSDEVVGLFPNDAARFFYCAKASKKDRGEGNNHPTVKPTDLMRYLCRLITPPGGVVLDPFAGSGSTGKAAKAEGFGFIGIEKQAEYAEIARQRIGGAA